MRLQSRPGARIVTACSLLLLTSASAFAQPAQPSPVAPPAQVSVQPAAPAATGPVRPLSVDEAVTLALEQNLGVQVQRINPQLQDLAIEQACTAWRPEFTAGLSAQSQDSPPSSFLSGANDKVSSTSTGGNLRREPAAALGHELRGQPMTRTGSQRTTFSRASTRSWGRIST